MTTTTVAVPPLAPLQSVPTPALIVDVALARENHRKALAALGPKQRLRPHFKAHKCPALARLQMEGGVTAFCCQTTWEAVVLAGMGIGDIMVTNQVVDTTALDELTEAARTSTVSALADARVHVDLLEAAARRAGVRLGVLIEIEVGMKRCGVMPQSDELIDLAAAIAASDVLSFAGVQSYDGHLVAMPDPEERRRGFQESNRLTRLAVDRLEAAGFPVAAVGGCSTGHMPYVAELDTWTDIQAGSYLMLDAIYRALPDLPFANALFGLATVIHRSPERVVLNMGLKHISVDNGFPVWVGDTSIPLRFSDEHISIAVPPSSTLAVGDRTFILPRHIDPTINLHPALWLLDGDTVTPAPLDGRMQIRG